MSGSTNSKIKSQNEQTERQYDYDKAYYDYQRKENKRNYKDAKYRTELQQAQADLQAKYRDEINKQSFEYQNDLQKIQFENEKRAYKQSLKDYDAQTELNSMSGALAQESLDRKLDESLISKNFDLTDLEIGRKRDLVEKRYQIDENKREVGFARRRLKLDKDLGEFNYINKTAQKDLRKNQLRGQQLDNDIQYLGTKQKIDLKRTDLEFAQSKTENFNQRIESMVKSKRNVGSIRASGREGLSAQASVSSALAEYGREQANLVDSLVFSRKDKSLTKKEIRSTTKVQIQGKKLDKKINNVERNQTILTRDRQLSVKKLTNSKLNLAFEKLKTDALSETAKIKKDFGFKEQEYKQSKRKVNTTFDSAKLQYRADVKKLSVDEYAANLAAQGRVLQKPVAPPTLPVPLETPRTKLPLPMEPTNPPKPIKGAMGKTSVWNTIGDGLNAGLQIASVAIPFF